MLDQIVASVIKNNIRAFGGVPDIVTIFGKLAGASILSNRSYLEIADTDPNLLEENSIVFQETINALEEVSMEEPITSTEPCYETVEGFPMLKYSCEPQYVVPDQYSSYRVTKEIRNYSSFSTAAYVGVVITAAATGAAGSIAHKLGAGGYATSGIAALGTLVARVVLLTTAPDYTGTFWVKNWSTYHYRYVYRPVTNVYKGADYNRSDLKAVKVGPMYRSDGTQFIRM